MPLTGLQQMLAAANAQSLGTLAESVVVNGKVLQGVFGDPEMMPVMVAEGYKDYLLIPLKISADQFPSTPPTHVSIERVSNGRPYFVQFVDYTNPVVYTFLLSDRQI